MRACVATLARTGIVLAILSIAAHAHAEPRDVDAARVAYDRGAAAYDAGDFGAAAESLARADELAPNDVALELALKAAVKSDDPRLAMTLAARADGRGSAPLIAAREAARAAMTPRVGRVLVSCTRGPEAKPGSSEASPCTATLDGASIPTEKTLFFLVGEHVAVIEGPGRRETIPFRLGSDAPIVVRGAAPTVDLKPSPPPPTRERSERSGASPAWFWTGVGLTAVLGGVTIASALDTQSKHDSFRADPSDDLQSRGRDAQLRTNLLAAGVAASALATLAVGLFVVKWGDR